MTEKQDTTGMTEQDRTVMTEESILDYLAWEEEKGLSANMLRRLKGQVYSLYNWLQGEKLLTREALFTWRRDMVSRGYSTETISNYVKGINRYLDYIGCSELRFNRGFSYDLTNMKFGYLVAIEPSVDRNRSDIVWTCRCKCGNLCKVPATSLVSGNTRSCGCLKAEQLHRVNKFIDHTSIRMSLEDRVKSDRSLSGYTGVSPKRGKWRAQIKYKGKNYSLGTYVDLDNAIKARSVAKQKVQENAQALLEVYEVLHKNDEKLAPPSPLKIEKIQPEESPESVAIRSDNKSGCTGVFQKRGKWAAKITYQKKTFFLGSFPDLEGAIAARKQAEQLLKEDPQCFQIKYGGQTNH